MSRDCPNCTRLAEQNAFLRSLLGQLIGGLRAAVAFITAEQDEPSMPPRTTIAAVRNRLTYLAEQAEGKRI
ncbi:hypothetical protein ACQP2F_41000 [Actinoplanes sp. CA-030573]|uniref:hypothetical protein n=1 Tax=Actinoplanes sp. CA-030573 TaxID=3239898 RepID=UPI003D92122E